MAHPDAEIYEFADFRLDVSEHVLSRGGGAVVITPKAFDLLALLVRNHGHLLTKEEIITALWEGSFVEEANLNVNISALRRVLGDSATEQRFIETVPRQGYRFVAEVRRPTSPAREAERPVVPPAGERGRSNIKRVVYPAVIAALVIGVAFGGWAAYRAVATRDPKPRSIAVLPFRPLSQDSSDEALEMGMTDALITKLGKLGELTIRPTSAVRRYGSENVDGMEAGRELQVEAVLEGKIQKAGNRVRVTVQLLRVSDGSTIWSDSFDDFFTNIFAVQDSISEKMAHSLSVKLSRQEQESIEKRYTENTEAYQLFLEAQFHHEQISEEGSRNAIRFYEAAVAKDPDYALAWANSVGAYAHLANLNGYSTDNLQKARDAANRAISIDPELAEAHEAQATILDFFDWNWPAAEKEYLKAIELGPNREGPHYSYSIFLSRFKRHDEAVREIRIASHVNPTAVYIQNQIVNTLYRARRYEEAMAEAKRSLSMKPDNNVANNFLFRIYLQMSRYSDAEAVMNRMLAAGTTQPEVLKARLYLHTGRRAEAEAILRSVIAEYKEGDTCWDVALNYVRLGDLDNAFKFLEKSFVRRESHMTALNLEPEWDPLRGDPRYSDLMRRMQLPD